MSYTVLARKYRPRCFASLVGQESTVNTLSNALTNQRLHHAYLFSGGRGVGKTSIARILAKCFNCKDKVTSTPCEQCTSCNDINLGRALDLIEIDAASNTKVEDMRELLVNVQYAPTRDRFKIYLIDEVHMLSGHSFNALLKTLEEPPAHVKFILATTDPQKLPVTVMSRCLQFHLKNVSPALITQQLQFICTQEQVTAEQPALNYLANSAEGSMRDALSLLDQAIAYSNGHLTTHAIQTMLGIVKDYELLRLLTAIAQRNAIHLIKGVENLVSQGNDCEQILTSLLGILHRIALLQLIPEVVDHNAISYTSLVEIASLFTKEDIQLLYQIAIIGRRDMPFAASPRNGLEMVLLRMLDFIPTELAETMSSPAAAIAPIPHNIQTKPAKPTPMPINDSWPELIERLSLSGLPLALARHCELQSITEREINLQIDPSHASLVNNKQKQRLQECIMAHFGKPMHVNIAISTNVNSPAQRQQHLAQHTKDTVLAVLENDPNVQAIMQAFSAKIDVNTIEAVEVKNS